MSESGIQEALVRNEATLIGTIVGVASKNEDRGWGLLGQASELRASDFRDSRHVIAWQAVVALLLEGAAPNAANVYAEVARRFGEEAARYVVELRLDSVDTDDVAQMVALVRIGSTLRRRYRFATAIVAAVNSASTGRALAEVEAEVSKMVEAFADRETPAVAARPVAELLEVQTRTIDVQRQRGTTLTGIASGVRSLDEMTGGWQDGALHLVCSVSGVGKTSFALQASLVAARSDVRTLVVSLEMDEPAVTRRMTTAYSGLSYTTIMRMPPGERARSTSGLAALPIKTVAKMGLTAYDICGIARRERSRDGLGLIVVDHCQMLGWAGDTRVPRFKQIGDSVWRLIDLANALRIPLLVTAQLNPPPPMKGGERGEPSAADIRDSKDPYNASSVCVVIHQERTAAGATGDARLIVSKNRFGPVGKLDVRYESASGTFSDSDETVPDERYEKPEKFED